MMHIYYRGTNNIYEPALLAQGILRKSVNQLTGDIEDGLSVSDVDDVGKYFRHMYLITGDEISTGSDGEPILDLDTAKFLRWVK